MLDSPRFPDRSYLTLTLTLPIPPPSHSQHNTCTYQASGSVESFSEAPSFAALVAAQPALAMDAAVPNPPAKLCIAVPASTPFDGSATTASTPIGSNTPTTEGTASEAASAGATGVGCVGQAERIDDVYVDFARAAVADFDSPSRSSPDPTVIPLVGALPAGEGEEAEEGKGGGESTAWELSSSSGDDDDCSMLSPVRWAIDR